MKPEQEKLDIIRRNVSDTIERARKEYDRCGMKVLEIGLLEGGAKDTFTHADVTTLDIIDGADIKLDICGGFNYAMLNNYDCIICTEVLEHTDTPYQATNNMRKWIKPGGKIFVTTPFDFRIHNPLPDNWRFTEHGLRILFQDFNDIKITPIGNERELMPICYRLTATK